MFCVIKIVSVKVFFFFFYFLFIKALKTISTNLFSALMKIRKVYWAPNQHIKIISEESCDTEDGWVMAAENSALHHRNKLHFKIQKNYK